MKKTLLSFVVATILGLSSAWSQSNNYDFWSVANNGDTLYYQITSDTSVMLIKCSPKPIGRFEIPNSAYYSNWEQTYSVTAIESSAFYNSIGLDTIVIPDGVQSIGYSAFYNCIELSHVVLPQSLNSIGSKAFYGCSSLSSVDLPSNLISIGESAFEESGLYSLIIPDNVESIGWYCFLNCHNLVIVTIGNGLTIIQPETFRNCYNLSSVHIGNSVTTIHRNSFENCSSLSSIIIPNNVTTIWYDAFLNCTGLKRLTLGTGLTTVQMNGQNSSHSPFSTCDSIEYFELNCNYYWSSDLYIPSGRIRTLVIGNNVNTMAYFYCPSLDTLIIGENLTQCALGSDDYHIYSCPKYVLFNNNQGIQYGSSWGGASGMPGLSLSRVNTFIIGDNVTRFPVSNGAFSDSLEIAIIGNSITSIPQNLFNNCSNFRTVSVGNSVNYIGSNAFYRCMNLDTIIAHPLSAPTLASDAFAVTRPNKKVIVPCNSNYDSVWGTTGFVYITGGYTLTLNSNNTACGNASFVQQVDCDQTAIIEATPTVGHRFVQWNDGNNDNPRTITLSQNTTLTAVFEAYNVNVSAISNNDMMGTVAGGGNIPVNSEVTLSASPACGHRFVMWNDSITSNLRTFIADKDTSFIAYFELAVDTIELHDTTYINVPVHDTTIIIDTVTLTEYVPVHDTTYIDVHDTTYINVPVHDTTYIDVHDTTYINIPIHDTTIITDTVMLTEYVSVHDTTYINVHDTTYINVPVHDTTVVTDTVIVSVHDTTYITQTDTLAVTQYDTIENYIHDTLTITDTLWLTQYDTILIHDTIFIHDTIVVGVGDVETVNAKIYTNNRQIVVEGADGNDVCLYDINGRILATKRDYGVPIRFDAPASGTYMIKIGDYPARKVVVIK